MPNGSRTQVCAFDPPGADGPLAALADELIDRLVDLLTSHSGTVPADSEQLARERAIKQIKDRRLFKISTASAAVGVTLLVPIWSVTEYRNAGGWPARGFGRRSGDKVWNIWIIYPFLAFALITAGHGWLVYGREPIPESEIHRVIDCQAADHRPSGS